MIPEGRRRVIVAIHVATSLPRSKHLAKLEAVDVCPEVI